MKKRISLHSMKHSLSAVVFLIGGVAIAMGSVTASERLPFIEEGKIWWYEVGEDRVWIKPPVLWREVVGITTKGETELNGQKWTECHLVDSIGNILTTSPLALIREEGSKVYVTSDHLKDSYEEWKEKIESQGMKYEHELTILLYASFLHRDLSIDLWGITYDIDTTFPALLYDFDWKKGDCFSWPWAWNYYDYQTDDLSPNKIYIKGKDRFQNNQITSTSWEIIDDRERAESSCHSGLIVDGIGLVTLTYVEYPFGTDNDNVGFFFNPGQHLPPIETCINATRRVPPILIKVERPDGTVIYENPTSSVRDINAQSPANNDESIYDLHGRVVTNPQLGSVYIRGGKKFVAK
ncbi:MAG: hypothetical protein K2N05_02800 [Muribaculaceae bacterium]|nr:hypothetical protein [Muribaculaceae bacterium]